jgi:hypothetical protein
MMLPSAYLSTNNRTPSTTKDDCISLCPATEDLTPLIPAIRALRSVTGVRQVSYPHLNPQHHPRTDNLVTMAPAIHQGPPCSPRQCLRDEKASAHHRTRGDAC